MTAKSSAHDNPAGPEPITATFLGFFLGWIFSGWAFSYAYLSSPAIPMGFSSTSEHLPSHILSLGHNLEQANGRLLDLLMIFRAELSLPQEMQLIKLGMSMEAGQPATQPGFWHFKHRDASFAASSLERDLSASSKIPFLLDSRLFIALAYPRHKFLKVN